jgi:formylglycine-generating enzyme required for sulfatase activity
MKKKILFACYIVWVSILIYVFMRLIHPPVSEQPMLKSQPHHVLKSWIEPKTRIHFIQLPKNCFYMGSPRHEKNRGEDEGPMHRFCLDSFWISKNEITVLQFQNFINNTRYITQAEKDGFSWAYDGKWKKRGGLYWKNPGFVQTQDHPVTHVTYHDALEMAQWISDRSKRFTLPTEAQWEYACRAQSDRSRFFGDDITKTCKFANVADLTIKQKYHAWTVHPCNDSFLYTAPVSSFSPNSFGLHDMLGNVWEWCINAYDHHAYLHPEKSYGVYSNQTPVSIRGGSWYTRPQYLRCANRDFVATLNRRSSDLGFRLIMWDKYK